LYTGRVVGSKAIPPYQLKDNYMKYKYDVILSFAGEDRAIVEELAKALIANDILVFYDSWEQSRLWGKDLYQYLDMIYQQSAQYCIVFVSENYSKKNWTTHELRSAQARAFQQKGEYILPIKLDDTKLPGIPDTVGYIDFRNTSIKQIVDMLIKKIGVRKQLAVEKINDIVRSEKVGDRMTALMFIDIYQMENYFDTVVNLMITDSSPEVRERAARTLDGFGNEKAINPLIEALQDNSFLVRSTAGWGLVHLGRKVTPSLQKLIKTSNNPEALEMADYVLRHI
jgi:hypothetical protein